MDGEQEFQGARIMNSQYPPGPPVNFALAVLSQFFPKLIRFDPLAFQLSVAQTYGDIAHYSVGPLHIYQLNHPDLVHDVLVERADKFYKARFLKRAFRTVLGNGLFFSDGDFWKRQRKLAQPAFHSKRIETYAQVMLEHTLRMLDTWQAGQTRAINREMMQLTLSVVVKALFDADVTREAGRVGDLMTAILDAANQRINSAVAISDRLPTLRNVRERRALRELDAILHRVIQERRASGKDTGDLLSMLLMAVDEDDGGQMTNQQLRDELMTIFLAGHETTANALTWTWYLLSQHPKVEAKLLDELNTVLGGRTPTIHDLRQLPYTEMVIKEAMRLYPPVGGITREPIQDITIGGYPVKKGSLIVITIHALHRDPRFFKDPEQFIPERFAPGWEEATPRYAYLPFGGGPRICLGNAFAMLESRLVLATVAQRYRLLLVPGQDVVAVQLVTLRPNDDILMALTVREPAARAPVALA
jgi:cytochrome P450